MSLKGKDNLISLFGGFCFFMSALELVIPKPLPFFRLGLANLPILIATEIFTFPAFLLLLVIKIVGQGLISGTFFSYIFFFSAASTTISGIVMYLLRKFPKTLISYIGISIAGAFGSTLAQIAIARFIIFGEGIMYAAPPMLILSCITGILLGVLAEAFVEDSFWYQSILDGTVVVPFIEPKQYKKNKSDYFKILAGIFLMILLLLVNKPELQAVILGTACILCIESKIKIHVCSSLVLAISVILINLYPAYGKIIFTIGSFKITSNALLIGIQKAVILEGMIYISKWILNFKVRLPGKIGEVMSQSFEVFCKLISVKKHINPKKLIPTLDAVMLGFDKL